MIVLIFLTFSLLNKFHFLLLCFSDSPLFLLLGLHPVINFLKFVHFIMDDIHSFSALLLPLFLFIQGSLFHSFLLHCF